MVLAPELSDTLLQAGRLMEGAADPWWVIASAAAALYGVEGLPVGDVDVLASERDARAALSRAGSAPFPPDPHPLFRSRVLGQVKTAPLPIEIMAGFEVRSGDAWAPIAPVSRVAVELDGVSLFIPSREELAEILTEMGRPKDLARAALLIPAVPPQA